MKQNRACTIGLYKRIRDCGRIFGNLENLGRRVFINTQLGEDCRVWLSHKVNANEVMRDIGTVGIFCHRPHDPRPAPLRQRTLSRDIFVYPFADSAFT
jgi:hypothetical protein